MGSLEGIFKQLKEAQPLLARQPRASRDAALHSVMAALNKARPKILAANMQDVSKARKAGMKEALIDRLTLDDARLTGIEAGIEEIIRLDDPLGKITGWTLPNGLIVEQTTVPLGVAAIIYESRPNVTVDAFCIAYKAGCPILLRGSSAAAESNRALVAAIQSGLANSCAGGLAGGLANGSAGGRLAGGRTNGGAGAAAGIADAVALACSGGHGEIDEIINARGFIDVVIPRGGRGLIRHVTDNARVPVIETGEGNCHIYVAPDAGLENAAAILENAKLQKPGACNAVETVLVHRDILARFMPLLAAKLAGRVALRCDAASQEAVLAANTGCAVTAAADEDWETEFLAPILAVKTVGSLDEAIQHINRYGTRHSEAILTRDSAAADEFFRRVDAACVYTNASTRFTDGGVFGFGAELGISTQKFHARGPMGLAALTTIKYRVRGAGQIR